MEERCKFLRSPAGKKAAKTLFDDSSHQVRQLLRRGQGLYFLKNYVISLDASTREQDALRAPIFVPPTAMSRALEEAEVYDFERGVYLREAEASPGKDKLHIMPSQLVFFRYAVEYARSVPARPRELVLRQKEANPLE